MTIADIIPAFVDYLRHERGAAQATITAYQSDIRRLGAQITKDVSLVTLDDLRAYQRLLSEQGLKQKTIERKFAAITILWLYMRTERLVSEDITDLIHIPKRPRRLPRWLESAQLRAFITTPDSSRYHKLRPRNQLAWLLMGVLALRRGEVLNLKAVDVQIGDRTLIIRDSKGGAERTLNIPDVLIQSLSAALVGKSGGDYVMQGERGGKWAAARFAKSFKRQVQAAGLPAWVTPHTIRHSVATFWVRSGVSIFTIQKLLGHSDIKTTMVYLHALPKDAQWATAHHVLSDTV
jgi:site-specific recombinase XerD